jgi:predicted secreted protein
MKLTSALAIYFLFWIMSAFFVLPFGVRTHDDDKVEVVPGQVTSAPVNFNPRQVAIRATWVSLALFGLYYLNYVQGWLTLKDIDVTRYIF